MVEDNIQLKVNAQQRKLNYLIKDKKVHITPATIPDFVKNLSSETFSDREMKLLNLGLNFALPPKTDKIRNFVIDVEAGIETLEYFKQIKLNEGEKEEIRMTAKDQIIKNKSKIETSKETIEYYEIIESLQKKNVYYTKADKGNTLVILDKTEYDNRMLKLINEGPYEKV